MSTKLSNDEVKNWIRQVDLSFEWRKAIGVESTWDRVIDYLEGKYFNIQDDDQISVNMVRPHVNVVIPAIYSRNPDVIVLPERRSAMESDELVRKRAEVMQNLLRYLMKKIGLKTEVKLCILDAVITGSAWIKTGYETEFEELKEASKQKDTIVSTVLKLVGKKEAPEEEDQELYTNYNIVSERPWALRTSPYDMIAPVLSRRTEELFWLGERILLPNDIVKEKYNISDLSPSTNATDLLMNLRNPKGTYKFKGSYGDDISYNLLYEIWDARTKQVYTLCDGYNKPLDQKDSEYTMLDSKNHPYIQLRFNEVIDRYYPQGDIEAAEPQLLELNDIRTSMTKHRKRYNRRYISKPGAFDPQAKADLKLGEDGTVIEITNTYVDQPIDGIMLPVVDAPLPPEVYAIEARTKDDIFTILGTSDYASRASGGARTATEASIMSSQARFRIEERVDLISDFVEKIVRNLAMISQKFMDSEQVGAIVGEDANYWVEMTNNKDIQGEFSYNVVYGSTTPINRELAQAQFAQFYAMAKDDPYFDQAKLRLQLVRVNGYENPESWLKPEIAKELEIQRMSAVKRGELLGTPANALGPQDGAPRVPRPITGQRLPTGQPRGLPGDLGQAPEIPGGSGGTQLAGRV